jgi:hypothetical protein
MNRIAWMLLAATPLAGCGLEDLKQPHPDRRFYDLRAGRPGAAAAPVAKDALLSVRRFRMSPRFEGVELVTRRDAVTWESDFYHAFLVAPAAILTEETHRWISASGIFGQVLGTGSLVEATHALEGTGAALYADLAGKDGPRAVIELQFALVDLRDVPRPVFRKAYRREVAVPEPAPPAFVAGWNAGLAAILGDLEKDLRGAPLGK